MRALVRCFDAWLRGRLGVFEFCDAPDCLLRIRPNTAARVLSLPDETIPAGAPVLELHLWNEHLPPLPAAGPDLAWAVQTRRKLIASFRTLAARIEQEPRFAGIRAVGGITVLLSPEEARQGKTLFQHLGFSISHHPEALGRFGEFWENLYTWWIMWAFNPATLRRRRLLHLRRMEVWMSAKEFLSRYGNAPQ